jgi:PIN domain nuclease of toxin-antitoxin system
MKLLLDTHTFIWTASRPKRLSPRVLSLISNPANAVLVSALSAFEIEYKRPRDPELAALPADLDEAITLQGFQWLPLVQAHAIAAGRLPRLHGDPFDRMLAAQALIEHATLVTRDPALVAYGCVTVW